MGNALMAPFATPYEAPDFKAIRPDDFVPAFEAAMAAHKSEADRIASNAEAPTFANTIDALELSGEALDRVSSVFWNLAGTDSTEEIRAIEREISPILAAHHQAIGANAALFQRIDTLFKAMDSLGLTPEQKQALVKIRTHAIKSGAQLEGAARARAAEIKQRLAALGTSFSQNVLKDETDWTMALTEADIAGLPDFLLSAARGEAQNRKLDGYVITLLRSSVEPFLVFSARRDLRERAFRAWSSRGDAGTTDNKPIVQETLALRAEYARLLGYPDYASMKLSDSMAKTAANASKLLADVWPAAKRRAAAERDELLALAKADGLDAIAPWDWRYYAEKLRQQKYALDEAVIKPYFQLEMMIQAAFDCATRLFRLTFAPAPDAPVYHPDVRGYTVKDAAGRHMALFYADYFARPGKHSGAWMSGFRGQQKLGRAIRPIITNVMNFSKPAAGEPALLSFDDARTLFHEFGHALHGMLSDVTYPSLSGTNVPRDFVELPSQLYEHWLEQPEILGKYAVHAQTGEPMPKALLDKLIATRTFNQGFSTVEYCASALVDLAFHTLADPGNIDVAAFEARTLAEIGMPPEITMRHRTPHFSHVFSGEGYSAGYYSYLWSEVLDADAFEAFREQGDSFDPETAKALSTYIYAAGHSREPDVAYTLFRGRLPTVDALLAKRGLDKAA
ncbi:MAG: M3 family metallopeptidase [Methylocystis sp.]|nr:M3 family metallopeptidase [Methylocystis sp.]MCA3584022.1 M3 family metallopeptidase [Methylocystis sp.]MCA3591636.1 M3 family metallopeptidase [Methylocystis sp.]